MEQISPDEAEKLRKVLQHLYGPLVNTWSINVGVYEVLGQLVTESGQCTTAMNLVPRPWDFSHPAKWAQRQARQALVRQLNAPEGQHYMTCIKAAARNYRTEFERAQLGL